MKYHSLVNPLITLFEGSYKKTQRETIQEAEKIFLIQPCIQELINTMGSIESVKTQLNQILVSLRKTSL